MAFDLIGNDTTKVCIAWKIRVAEPETLAKTHRLLRLCLDCRRGVVPPRVPGVGVGSRWVSTIGIRSIGIRSVGIGRVGIGRVGIRSVGIGRVRIGRVGIWGVGIRSVGIRVTWSGIG